ncbi:hypothetical protein MMPV_006153 [Pyropia vietnamensis]
MVAASASSAAAGTPFAGFAATATAAASAATAATASAAAAAAAAATSMPAFVTAPGSSWLRAAAAPTRPVEAVSVISPLGRSAFVGGPLGATRWQPAAASSRRRCRGPPLTAAIAESPDGAAAASTSSPPSPPAGTDAGATTATASATAPLRKLVQDPATRRYVFVGGKGGVGKTSTAAALALRFADAGLRTLVLSTDPAHSLGDALDVDLSGGKVTPVTPGLDALESDTADAVAELRAILSSVKGDGNGGNGGNGRDGGDGGSSGGDTSETDAAGSGNAAFLGKLGKQLGLSEFGEVLDTIPPGADEFVALTKVLRLVESPDAAVHYDRVVIDTAPTGHTLRLLAFPDFLDSFLAKAVALRSRLDGAASLLSATGNLSSILSSVAGGGGGSTPSKKDVQRATAVAAERVAAYREQMAELSDLFRDPGRSEFVVVSIPTELSVAESRRLVDALWAEGIWVRNLVVNQVVPAGSEASYVARLCAGQAAQIARIRDSATLGSLHLTQVPRFDTEVRGVYGLRALSTVAYPDAHLSERWGDLFDAAVASGGNPDDAPAAPTDAANADASGLGAAARFVFVGGKGGVGKTSSAAAMGVKLADAGIRTLVLSTDPAHSLGDALALDLSGGAPVPVDATGNLLYAMEIDTAAAVAQFRGVIQSLATGTGGGVGGDLARKLGVGEFADILDNTPPGVDELVALVQVVDLVRTGGFDRVIIDTAPTGHTLRLLAFPEFIDAFLGRVLRLKARLDGALNKVKSLFGGGKKNQDAAEADLANASNAVDRFRRNMTALRAVIQDQKATQFAVVTIPTALAVAESERLVSALRTDGVAVANVIVNLVLPDSAAESYVRRLVRGQQGCLDKLREASAAKDVAVTQVPFFDVEVRGEHGLRAMGEVMFADSQGASPRGKAKE